MWLHVNTRPSYVEPGRESLNITNRALSQAAQPNAMIKEAILCGLSAIMDFSGAHYQSAPKVGTIHDQTSVYWKNVGKYIDVGIKSESPKVQIAKQRQLELDLNKA